MPDNTIVPKAMKTGIAMLSGLLWLGLMGPCLAAAGDLHGAVAQFGSTRLTAAELRDFVDSLQPEMRQQASANPLVLRQLVQLEIIRKAIYSEAIAKKWPERPQIARQLASSRQAIVLKSYLTSIVTLPANYPSEQDIQATYKLNQDKFMVPRQYHLAQIFLAFSNGEKNSPGARKKADELVATIRAGKGNFAALAKQNSQHKPSAGRGGDMGWLVETQIMPEMLTKIAGIARGDISDPIRSDQGWHIVRVLDTRPAAPRALAQVRPMIVASLRQQKQQSEEQQYIVRLLQKTPVTLDEPQLRKVLVAAK